MGGSSMTGWKGAAEQRNLLARQLVNTMYEVTVSSVVTVGLLRVVAAPGVTHSWRRGGGGHCQEDGQTGKTRAQISISRLCTAGHRMQWQQDAALHTRLDATYLPDLLSESQRA